MKTASVDVRLSIQDRIGRRLAARLDASVNDLPHDISERLRVARLQALSRLQEVRRAETVALHAGNGGAAVMGGGDDGSLWPQLVSIIPLLALAAGLVLIQVVGSDRFVRDQAEIDAALLTDDLPPAAYADPGFAQFLKARAEQFK